KNAYATMIAAARSVQVKIDPTEWPGYYTFSDDFWLHTPVILDQSDAPRLDGNLLAEGASLADAQELEYLSVGAGSLPEDARRPPTRGPSDITLAGAFASGISLPPPAASPRPSLAASRRGIGHTAATLTRIPAPRRKIRE